MISHDERRRIRRTNKRRTTRIRKMRRKNEKRNQATLTMANEEMLNKHLSKPYTPWYSRPTKKERSELIKQ